MTTTVNISADRRTETGKGAARQLRMKGRVPAVIYGQGRDPEPLTLSAAEFEKTMAHVSASTIVDLTIDGKMVRTLVREIQRHPVQPGVMHVDFLEVHEGVTLTVNVPLHLKGTPEGVRVAGGMLDWSLREIEVEVLPKNMPSHIDVDVTDLGVGQSIHVSDLDVQNATVLTEDDQTICSVIPPRIEEEEPTAEVIEEEGEPEPELIRKPKAEGEEEEG